MPAAKQKSEKAFQRGLMKMWSADCVRHERECKWWFENRHWWSQEGGGWEHARDRFLFYRAELKKARKRLARTTARYLALYRSK